MSDTIELVATSATHSSTATRAHQDVTAQAAGSSEATQANEAEDESQYPQGWKFWSVFINVVLTIMFVSLDFSMIVTAIPKITDEFQSILDVGWYFSAMLLTFASFQFLYGQIYAIYSIKWVYAWSMGVFVLGNLIAALAPSSNVLIAGRAVGGLGWSGVTSGLLLMLTVGIPRRKRPIYAAIGGGVELVCAAAGPVLGGVITQNLSWRWCFWINLPLGAASLLVTLLLMHDPRPQVDQSLSWRAKLKKVDLLSSAFFVPAITTLLLALQWGGHEHGWSSPVIICLFIAFALLIAIFALVQYRKGDDAMLPLRIIGQRSILSGMLFTFFVSSSQAVVNIYMPIYLQTAKQRTPSQSGVEILPSVGGLFFAVALAGPLISMLGYYTPFMLATGVMAPIAIGLLTTLTADSSMGKFYALEVFFGLAFGIGVQAPQTLAQTVPGSLKDISMACATVVFAQGAGPMIFVAVAQTIFTSQLKTDLVKYAPSLDATQAFGGTGLSDLASEVAPDALQDVLEAFAAAVTKTWFLSVGLACASFVCAASTEWLSVKKKQA